MVWWLVRVIQGPEVEDWGTGSTHCLYQLLSCNQSLFHLMTCGAKRHGTGLGPKLCVVPFKTDCNTTKKLEEPLEVSKFWAKRGLKTKFRFISGPKYGQILTKTP